MPSTPVNGAGRHSLHGGNGQPGRGDPGLRCRGPAHWPRIFRFVLASLRDRDTAQTLTQDCFLKAYRSRERFRGEASLHTWLIQIAINLIRDFGRNRRLQFLEARPFVRAGCERRERLIPGREVSAESRALIQEQVEGIWRATERLSERQRTVFLLRFVEDRELLEIAAATRMTEGAESPEPGAILRSVPTTQAPRPVRWVMAAIVSLILGAIPVSYKHQREQQRAAEQAREDMVLLEKVNAGISRAVPRSLEPLLGRRETQ